jgi:hypothetical protein
MGSCNCKESSAEQSTATLDPSIKFSVSKKVDKQLFQGNQAIIDFENSQFELQGKAHTLESQNLSKPSSLQAIQTESISSHSLEAHENPICEPEVAAETAEMTDKDFILSCLSQVEKEEYQSVGNFKYMDQAAYIAKIALGEDIYFGEIDANKSPLGFGLLLKADGSIIEGTWTNGTIHSQGLQIYPNGDSYVGSFEHGEVSGMGKFVNYNGATYEGEWKNSKQNGEGTETWGDGAVYQGSFREGKKEGFGRFVWADHAKYEGEFHGNNLEGKGRYTWNDGRVYEGGWRNNKMHGFGRFLWGDGKVYEGYYEDDQKQGKGTFTWPNGKKYDGLWQNNRMHGKGTIIQPNGSRQEGLWEDGKQVSPHN